MPEFCLHIGCVPLQVTDDHSNIPVSKSFFPDQLPDIQCRLMDFLSGRKCLEHTDLTLFLHIRLILIAKQVLLQIP